MSTYILELLFKDATGKTKKINIANPKPELTAPEAQQALETIANTEIFQSENGDHYAEVVGARYVARQVEDIYTVA